MSRALPRLAAIILMVFPLAHFAAPPIAAQELAATALFPVASSQITVARAPLFSAPQPPTALAGSAAPAAPDFSRIRRPSVLPALYASTAVTQILDAHSTMKALGQGAREVNPVMQGATNNGATLLAVKAGATVGTIFLAEKMWRRNRAAAIGMMVAVNAVTAVVAAHNYAVASRLH